MRIKLQLVVCHDDGYEETVTDIITLNKNNPDSTGFRDSPKLKINYHPQSGWFEDAPLKGGAVVRGPLRGHRDQQPS